MTNSSQIKVHGIGQTQPSSNLTLYFVLYIAGCPFNLISINMLTRTQNYYVFLLIIIFIIKTNIPNRQLEQEMSFEDYTIYHNWLLISPLCFKLLSINA